MNQSMKIIIFLLFNLNFLNAIKDVIQLQATNFELILSNYRYAAILFYDHSTQDLLQEWKEAAALEILASVKDTECKYFKDK